jgi:hypothetical protein
VIVVRGRKPTRDETREQSPASLGYALLHLRCELSGSDVAVSTVGCATLRFPVNRAEVGGVVAGLADMPGTTDGPRTCEIIPVDRRVYGESCCK